MRNRWIGIALLAAMWVFVAAFFSALPARVPTHWNLAGEIDGWSPRFPGAFIAPAIATLVFALINGMATIDPRRRNVEHFAADRALLANVMVMFFALVTGVTTGAALGWPVDVGTWMTIGVGMLLMVLGNYLPRIRSNWWMGIRTPWTMDNERVWRDTHRLGGRLFVVGGALLVASILLPERLRGAVLISVVAVIAIVPLAYSFILWRREARS